MNLEDYKLIAEVEKEGKVLLALINCCGGGPALVWYDPSSKNSRLNEDGSYPHGCAYVRDNSYIQLGYYEAKDMHIYLKEKSNDN